MTTDHVADAPVLEPGVFATYERDDRESTVLVVNRRDETAGEVFVPQGGPDAEPVSVADYHDDTDPDDPVVDVMFVDQLDGKYAGWRETFTALGAAESHTGWLRFDDWLRSFEQEWRVSARRYSFATRQLDPVPDYEVVRVDEEA